jgi:hypothetical protein
MATRTRPPRVTVLTRLLDDPRRRAFEDAVGIGDGTAPSAARDGSCRIIEDVAARDANAAVLSTSRLGNWPPEQQESRSTPRQTGVRFGIE